MSYSDFLASRGYRRVTVQRTDKAPGDLVLHGRSMERIPTIPNVVAIARRKGQG